MPPVRDVVWEYNRSDSYIEGSQDRAGQTQYLDGTPDMLAKYAVWWRRQVDPKQDLIFYNDGYTVVVPLTNDTTEETILKALHDS